MRMEKHIYDEKNGLGYTLHGDYYLPDIVLDEEKPTYGKYGMIEAREQVEMLIEQMAEREGATEKMKAEQPMEWVRRMNAIKNTAEEIVLANIVCD